MCDTELTPNPTNDYMTLVISADNGSSYQNGITFDENTILNQGGTQLGAFAGLEFTHLNIPTAYLTSGYKMRFHWVTNSSLNIYYGCNVTDIVVNQNRKIPPVNGYLTYGFLDGTSMASPVVAGITSLVWGYDPLLTYAQVKTAILNSGDSKASLAGKTVSGKRVNAYNALSAVQSLAEVDAVAAINSATSGTMGATITTYATILSLILTDYNSLTNKTPLHLALVRHAYANKGAVKTAFDTAVGIEKALETFTSVRWRYTDGWDTNRLNNLVSGDFNGDANVDMASIYDYGAGMMGIWVFRNNGNNTSSEVRYNYLSGWDASKLSNLVSGDFNNDGRIDIAGIYNYGATNYIGLWVFINNGNNTFTPQIWGYYSGWDGSRLSSLAAGDFDGDGKTDLSALYNYGSPYMGIWVFRNNNNSTFTPQRWLYANGWDPARMSNFIAGDFTVDGKTDLATTYNYGSGMMGIWVFKNTTGSFTPERWQYMSGWDASRLSTLVAGDFDMNGRIDIASIYTYNPVTMGVWVFANTADKNFTPARWMYSSGWDTARISNLVSGNFSNDSKPDIGLLYNHGSTYFSLWIFK